MIRFCSELCMVCSEETKPYDYYGGKCCTSCRQFFRRTIVEMSR